MHTQKQIRSLARKSILHLAALLVTTGLFAQDALVKRANVRYEALSFSEAASLYERAALKGASDAQVASRTADCYWRVRDMGNAERWYAKATSLPIASPTDVYRYSGTLRSNGKTLEADAAMKRYQELAAADSRIDRQLNSNSYAKELMERNTFGAQVKALAVNSERCDMGVGFIGDEVTFASSRKVKAAEVRNHTWNGAPFLDLYIARSDSLGALSDVRELDGPFNTKFHESNTAINPSGQEIWFTRNNYVGNVRRKDEKGVTGLKIFSASRIGSGPWSAERPFAHNSDQYSVGHPALSTDGTRLYFTSNMPGGAGGTDIWYCDRSEAGAWGTPVNVGNKVNTEGNEMFPFAGLDRVLFFASDGHKGLGGMDVLMANITGNSIGTVRNLGAPINSTADDFAFVLRNDGLSGYLSSNRNGGFGDDDIYSVSLAKRPGTELKVNGVALNDVTKMPLSDVVVNMKDANGTILSSTTTAKDGAYAFTLEPNTRYTITGEKPEHSMAEFAIPSLPEQDTLLVRDLGLMEERTILFWLHVTDARTNAPLGDVDVRITDLTTNSLMMEGRTDANGDIRTAIEDMSIGDLLDLRIKMARVEYITKKTPYKAPLMQFGEIRLHELLDLRMQAADLGADLGKLINVKPIYFDLGRHAIRKDAAEELDKIVEVMEGSPTMVIELGSHTDCRGSKSNNEALSDRRAKSSAAYIIAKGISKDRITGTGFGENKLVTDCPCEGAVKSKCSEEDHQLNRRTEFIIVKN